MVNSLDGTRAQDNLLVGSSVIRRAAIHEGYTRRRQRIPRRIEVNTRNLRAREQHQVLPRLIRVVVRRRRIRPRAVRGIDIARALVRADHIAPQRVVVARDAERLERGDPRLGRLGDIVAEGDADGAAGTDVGGVGARLQRALLIGGGPGPGLGLLHVVEELIPVPSRVSELFDNVVVGLRCAVPDEEVEDRVETTFPVAEEYILTDDPTMEKK